MSGVVMRALVHQACLPAQRQQVNLFLGLLLAFDLVERKNAAVPVLVEGEAGLHRAELLADIAVGVECAMQHDQRLLRMVGAAFGETQLLICCGERRRQIGSAMFGDEAIGEKAHGLLALFRCHRGHDRNGRPAEAR